jgi:uncharacterized protein DUF4185
MRMSRTFALLAAMFIGPIGALPIGAHAATLSLVGSSTKVCQVIGDKDWATNLPTAAQTLSNFGLDAVDLGFPVDSAPGPLYFLFGDALPVTHPPSTVPPDDALGTTTRTALPDSATCLDLQLATSAPKTFAHPTVQPAIQQGSFNVPSGGVFFDNTLYAFFWTGHCLLPPPLAPDPTAPLTLPAASLACAEIAASNSVGRSVLAAATSAEPLRFHWTPPRPDPLRIDPLQQMPSGFVYVTAAKPPSEIEPRPRLLPSEGGIPVFGVARYRASIPYLAIAPRETFGDPATWSFFAGRRTILGHPTEEPIWITRREWESGRNPNGQWMPPAGAEIFAAPPAGQRCVGEHAVNWNAPLRVWLLLYNCDGSVEARFAPEPWGPWSPPIVMISALDPTLRCTLLQNQSATGCPGLRNYWTLGSDTFPGFFYAPFVMDRFTRDATAPGPGQPKRATIDWLVSTWNPYTVVVMHSTLELQ